MAMDIPLVNEQATKTLARQFARFISPPMVLAFCGEIGAGKTTFIRAMLQALGVDSRIKSPTFSLVESYDTDTFLVHHFDLYRIHEETELEYIGFRDYFADNAVCCIEWPEQAPNALPQVDVMITLRIEHDGRLWQATSASVLGQQFLASFLESI